MRKMLAILFALSLPAYADVTATQAGTAPVTVSASALPAGAATESTLSTLNGKVITTSNGIAIDLIQSGSAVSAASPLNVKLPLQQDLIDNTNSLQPNRTFGYVFGHNSMVQNVRCDLWSGPTCIYVFPATAQQMALSSDSANDTTGGTGCQQLFIHYLDASFIPKTATVNLNGLTPVNTTVTDIFRLNAMHCTIVGSGQNAAGTISLKNIAGTVTYDLIEPGNNAARQAIYTVPVGVAGYISHWQASSGAASGSHFTQIEIRSTSHEGILIPGVFILVDEVGTLNNGTSVTLPIPIRIAPTADVKMSAISDAANANAIVTGAIMGWFE